MATIKKAQNGVRAGITKGPDGGFTATPYEKKTSFNTVRGKKIERVITNTKTGTSSKTKMNTKEDDAAKRKQTIDSTSTMRNRDFNARQTNLERVVGRNLGLAEYKSGGKLSKSKKKK